MGREPDALRLVVQEHRAGPWMLNKVLSADAVHNRL
jgi:hypothetical protein